jgi:hypothetical protein
MDARLTIVIDVKHDALQTDLEFEAGKILEKYAQAVRNGDFNKVLRDVNGNEVGYAELRVRD